MENLTHTLAGLVLCKAGLEQKTPLATPALVIAANLPDIDLLGVIFGKNYLDFHRGITHSAVGVACLSLALSAAFWGLSRARESWRDSKKFLPLLYVCFIGVLSHTLLDFLNDYGVRPWLPFSARKHYGDLVSVVDPWIWIILGTGLFLSATSMTGKLAWGGLGLVLTVVVVLGGGRALALLWLIVLGLALWGGRLLRRQGLQPARLAFMLFFIYLGGLGVVRAGVMRSARDVGPELLTEPLQKIAVLPRRPNALPRWTVVLETPERFYLADVGLGNWRRQPPEFQSYVKNLDDPCYQESLSQPGIAPMSRFARFPSVDVQVSGNKCTVFLRDLRYARESVPGWGVAKATVVLEPKPSRRSP